MLALYNILVLDVAEFEFVIN